MKPPAVPENSLLPHSGFVSILGRPNAGKSTLLNALAGSKVAIVSAKPQTTRASIQAVITQPGAQIAFLDTPGIHESGTLLSRRMMEAVRAALEERDLLLFVADAAAPFEDQDREAVSMLKGVRAPSLLVLNKIDRVRDKRLLLPLVERYQALHDFAESIPISASTGEGIDTLLKATIARLPEGPAYFPAGYLTDQPERYMAAELIREKILDETRQEVPHSVAVLIDRWEETPRLLRIGATIYVERAGQKGIVIGAGGAMLKVIGSRARLEMEKLLGRKIFLELFVKVRPAWRESKDFLDSIDWRSMSGRELEESPENE